MSRVIKVAQVLGRASVGGVESCIMNYYRNIDKTKVQFDFLVENTSSIIDKDEIEAMGGHVIFIPSYKNPIRYMRVLEHIFRDGNYDIVHSNMNTISVFVLRAAKRAGVSARIAHSHSTANKKELIKTFIKLCLKPFSRKYATHFFACSELAGRWLFGTNVFKAGKVILINNAIELKRFAFNTDIRSQMREQLGVKDDFVVGHVGRFVQQKNQKYLLEIFSEILRIIPRSVLLLVGSGPLQADLVMFAEKLNIISKIVFVGAQQCPENYYQAMDCFVLPSLYEGLPIVGIEAQINGLNSFLSNTITQEVKINNNVQFISISKPAQVWACEIVNLAKNCDAVLMEKTRLEYVNAFHGSKYDISFEANKLLSLYQDMIGIYENI